MALITENVIWFPDRQISKTKIENNTVQTLYPLTSEDLHS